MSNHDHLMNSRGPHFSDEFYHQFEKLLIWRRDTRHFLTSSVDEALLQDIERLTDLSPSVGNSQPWRFVRIMKSDVRAEVLNVFSRSNEEAARLYHGKRADAYRRLKLQGLRDAPVHYAVFCQRNAEQGAGLGRQTMPETLHYSVVTAIYTFWLAARCRGLGVGWVSILEPGDIHRFVEAPNDWDFVAYLCVGWPRFTDDRPELERRDWQERTASDKRFMVLD